MTGSDTGYSGLELAALAAMDRLLPGPAHLDVAKYRMTLHLDHEAPPSPGDGRHRAFDVAPHPDARDLDFHSVRNDDLDVP